MREWPQNRIWCKVVAFSYYTMKRLTRPQTAIPCAVVAVVIGGSIYAYTENKKAYDHEQRCLSLEGELIRLAKEKKEVNDQLDQLMTDKYGSDYANSVFMQSRERIIELMARGSSLQEQMIGNNGWAPALRNECGDPRFAKVVRTYPDLFPTKP